MNIDTRLNQLKDWASQSLAHSVTLKPMLGDASFRRYYFIEEQPKLIAVDSPPASENNQGFIAIAQHFQNLGLNVPQIEHQDLHQGFFIVSFIAGKLLHNTLNLDNCTTIYHQAIDQLITIQKNPAPHFYQPPEFNAIKLTNELEGFQDWFIHELIHYELNGEEHYHIIKCFEKLIQNAVNQPYVVMHRDYHSRNLLWQPDHSPPIGILDFQDTVMGPITYDLVSLIRDCYITWPDAVVRECVQYYYFKAKNEALLQGVSFDQFMRWFDWMGLQRHLKAIFIFARKYLRDYNDGYLQYIEPTLQYINHVTEQYDELAPLHELISMNLIPLWTELQTL